MTLYSTDILRRSKDFRTVEKPSVVTHSHRLSNPICGDRVECLLHISNDRVMDAWIAVKGCALCKASASLILENVLGKSVQDVSNRTEKFLEDVNALLDGHTTMGEASLFEALPWAPARKECVVLPWRCLSAALNQET